MTFQKVFLAFVILLLIKIHHGFVHHQLSRRRFGFRTTIFVATPLGPTGHPNTKDYIDVAVENKINDGLSKIFDKIDVSLKETKRENAESLKETKRENAKSLNEVTTKLNRP